MHCIDISLGGLSCLLGGLLLSPASDLGIGFYPIYRWRPMPVSSLIVHKDRRFVLDVNILRIFQVRLFDFVLFRNQNFWPMILILCLRMSYGGAFSTIIDREIVRYRWFRRLKLKEYTSSGCYNWRQTLWRFQRSPWSIIFCCLNHSSVIESAWCPPPSRCILGSIRHYYEW